MAPEIASCDHEWFDEAGYRICASCGVGSPELGYLPVAPPAVRSVGWFARALRAFGRRF